MDQYIYDLIFSDVKNDQTFFIVGVTDNQWFKRNSKSDLKIRLSSKGIDYISQKHIDKFYQINQESNPVKWNPLNFQPNYLPAKWVALTKNNFKELCLVEDRSLCIDQGYQDKCYRPYHSISKVAFSDDQTVALVKVGYNCAPLSGAHESVYIFKLKDGKWVFDKEILYWIS